MKRPLRPAAIGFLVLVFAHDPVAAQNTGFAGFLRARDLSPFGFLRLDMRPAHAVTSEVGAWAIETEFAYQNTWALSPEVERYLTGLEPRRELGPDELQTIRDLPGENYLLDVELAEVDMTFHYKFSQRWSTYLTVSAVKYGGGFLDSSIESFHDALGFSTFGRDGAARNDANVIFDLNTSQVAIFESPTRGGMLDPTVGVRYSGAEPFKGWNLAVEAAVKIPVQGRRALLSTGDVDAGVQATLQRFGRNHAYYFGLSGVYYDGRNSITPTPPQIVPTLVMAYERRVGERTNLILQAYVSPSIYTQEETELDDLLATKYQLSLGIYHRWGQSLLSFGITENLQNLNNTPDIALQLGWAYGSALRTMKR
jgi:hypothetical protein